MFKNMLLSSMILLSSASLLHAEKIHQIIKCGGAKAEFIANNIAIDYNENQRLLINGKSVKLDDTLYYSNLSCVTVKRGVKFCSFF